MKIISLLSCIVAVMFYINIAYAGTKVLGFEINVSTADQVKNALSSQTNVVDAGINKYSRGTSLLTDGDSYEIEGLHNVGYIFDSQNKLVAVVMVMNKDRFDSVFNAVSAKYKGYPTKNHLSDIDSQN